MSSSAPVDKVNVFIHKDTLAGQLRLVGKEILFKYADSYLKNGHNLSPIKLRFDDSIQTAAPAPFRGLHGVFSDSLPDAWGMLLLRKHLSHNGVLLETLSMLDLLCLIGKDSTGALHFEPGKTTDTTSEPILLDQLNLHSQQILSGEAGVDIEQFIQTGGSPGGARPKVNLFHNTQTNKLFPHLLADPTAEDQPWIIKFSALTDLEDLAQVEFAYNLMAEECGLIVHDFKLFQGESGNSYFGSRRFDRKQGEKIHMISAAALMNDDYERSTLDYGHLLDATLKLTGSAAEMSKLFRLACFNVFAHNRDDHSKNFSFLMDKKGKWSLSPAYDLTFSASSQGLHSTSCAGNSKNPGADELLELASDFSIRKGEQILREVMLGVRNFRKHAKAAGVSGETTELILAAIRGSL